MLCLKGERPFSIFEHHKTTALRQCLACGAQPMYMVPGPPRGEDPGFNIRCNTCKQAYTLRPDKVGRQIWSWKRG